MLGPGSLLENLQVGYLIQVGDDNQPVIVLVKFPAVGVVMAAELEPPAGGFLHFLVGFQRMPQQLVGVIQVHLFAGVLVAGHQGFHDPGNVGGSGGYRGVGAGGRLPELAGPVPVFPGHSALEPVKFIRELIHVDKGHQHGIEYFLGITEPFFLAGVIIEAVKGLGRKGKDVDRRFAGMVFEQQAVIFQHLELVVHGFHRPFQVFLIAGKGIGAQHDVNSELAGVKGVEVILPDEPGRFGRRVHHRPPVPSPALGVPHQAGMHLVKIYEQRFPGRRVPGQRILGQERFHVVGLGPEKALPLLGVDRLVHEVTEERMVGRVPAHLLQVEAVGIHGVLQPGAVAGDVEHGHEGLAGHLVVPVVGRPLVGMVDPAFPGNRPGHVAHQVLFNLVQVDLFKVKAVLFQVTVIARVDILVGKGGHQVEADFLPRFYFCCLPDKQAVLVQNPPAAGEVVAGGIALDFPGQHARGGQPIAADGKGVAVGKTQGLNVPGAEQLGRPEGGIYNPVSRQGEQVDVRHLIRPVIPDAVVKDKLRSFQADFQPMAQALALVGAQNQDLPPSFILYYFMLFKIDIPFVGRVFFRFLGIPHGEEGIVRITFGLPDQADDVVRAERRVKLAGPVPAQVAVAQLAAVAHLLQVIAVPARVQVPGLRRRFVRIQGLVSLPDIHEIQPQVNLAVVHLYDIARRVAPVLVIVMPDQAGRL